jgi:hypothetical protein
MSFKDVSSESLDKKRGVAQICVADETRIATLVIEGVTTFYGKCIIGEHATFEFGYLSISFGIH